MKERDASDLHIVAGVSPAFRIHGKLTFDRGNPLTPEDTEKLIYSILNEEQRKKLENKQELDFSFALSGVGRFRINAHWQRGSLACAIRHIPERIPSLRELNLPPIIAELALKDRGLILVTGPTGCGKSTTQAVMVDIINEKRFSHIITIEDPIEYLHHHKSSVIEQREVGMDTSSFATSLKYALRQDPDVILIGEMRDLETIATGITAAETGHLVIGTLHTPDAPQAIDRIIDVFPPYQQPQIRMQLSTSLVAIIAQKLLPLRSGKGRIPAVEILLATPAVRNIIREAKTHQLYTVMETGSQYGMQSMDQALRELVKEGKVSLKEALERARDPNALRESLRGERIGLKPF